MKNSNRVNKTETVAFYIDTDHPVAEDDFKLLKKRLNSCGITILKDENLMSISFYPDLYNKAMTRNAGAKHKLPLKDSVIDEFQEEVVLADIIYWKYGQHLTWTDIAKNCYLSRASIFRKKKEWELDINEFLSIADPDRCDDYEYLLTLPHAKRILL